MCHNAVDPDLPAWCHHSLRLQTPQWPDRIFAWSLTYSSISIAFSSADGSFGDLLRWQKSWNQGWSSSMTVPLAVLPRPNWCINFKTSEASSLRLLCISGRQCCRDTFFSLVSPIYIATISSLLLECPTPMFRFAFWGSAGWGISVLQDFVGRGRVWLFLW